MALVYLLLGSNLGKKKNTLSKAISLIGKHIGNVNKISSLYKTEPWGFSHAENFLNQVIEMHCQLSPEDLLSHIKKMENEFGRERSEDGYNARTLDIDILFYDGLVCESNKLTIPHPRLHLRLFTLIPLAELNAELVHPVFKKTIAVLITQCNDKCKVVML